MSALAALAAAIALLGAPAPEVRSCQERVEGPGVVPDPSRDTIIGPISLTGLPGAYRGLAATPESEFDLIPGLGIPGIKALAVLRAGARVTLEVPRRQRRWMKLDYNHALGEPARERLTLQACRRLHSRRARRAECGWRPFLACRWRYTQFAGGIALDVVDAPRHGVCAELIVRVRGRDRPLRERIFAPKPGECD
jgi:hypothetical protein